MLLPRPDVSSLAATALTILALILTAGAGPVGAAPQPPTPSPAVPGPQQAGQRDAPEVIRAPRVLGEPEVGGTLRATRGRWQGDPTTFSYVWLRDGEPIPGARSRRLRLGVDRLGARISVRVRATDAEGRSGSADSASVRVRRGGFDILRKPSLRGTARFESTLRARSGGWRPRPARISYQWLRGARPVRGATDRRYRLGADDVGRRVRVKVTVRRPGYAPATRRSERVRVKHRVGVRRVATYHVETRGRITTSLRRFVRQSASTYADARGWRAAGVRLKRVRSGGDFTLVLAEASWLPRFSPGCSVEWSCRVGRFVIINQDRWKYASDAWRGAGGSLRGYRHMVVNHETGHWLGHGHASCGGQGHRAPLMMQQSKGLSGCRFNPWPLPSERWFNARPSPGVHAE